MKTSLLVSFSLIATATTFGQGAFNFNNKPVATGPAPVTIGLRAAPGEGDVGAYVGSAYTASLFYLPGEGYTQATFDNGNPIFFPDADTPFFGVTGFIPGPAGGFVGPGYFDGGYVVLPLPILDKVTVEIRVWYSVGASSYDDALAKGFNVGKSKPVSVRLTYWPLGPEHLDGLQAFTVHSVPEPSCLVLGVLGIATLCLLRTAR
jgi:hypothetical protein